MAEALAIDWSKPIPLFPLQDCVVLPHATVPLHVFEPRYRAMVADALDSRGLIAMATFDGDAWQSNYHGKPAIRPCVCVGMIARHDKLPDGRYNLLLQGLARASVRHELPHDPYRTALLAPTERTTPMEIDLDESRQAIERLLADPVLARVEPVAAIANWLSEEIPTIVLVDLAIMTCCRDGECRYAMLAEPDAAARSWWLARRLRDERDKLIHDAPPLSEQGWGLN